MQTTIPEIREMRCLCGAPRGPRGKRCAKCRARARWYRRKAWHTNPIPAINRTGKK